MSMKDRWVIGTRGSKLALWQAHAVKDALESRCGIRVEIEIISTRGDRKLDIALHDHNLSKGLFTQELEEGLRKGTIDFAVHSLKDLPVEDAEGLKLTATLPRADVRDVILSPHPIRDLRELSGKHVGTSSPRRVAQMERYFEEIGEESPRLSPVRGNVETRIRKMYDGEYDALVMAAAGIHRLGLENEIALYLDLDTMLPAPGQGAVAVQCALSNREACDMASRINDEPTLSATHAERSLLQALGGGCSLPMGCCCRADGDGSLSGEAYFQPSTGKHRRVSFTLHRDYTDSDLALIAKKLQE